MSYRETILDHATRAARRLDRRPAVDLFLNVYRPGPRDPQAAGYLQEAALFADVDAAAEEAAGWEDDYAFTVLIPAAGALRLIDLSDHGEAIMRDEEADAAAWRELVDSYLERPAGC